MPHPGHASAPLDCLGCRVLDTLDDPTLIVDREGRIVFWNRAAAAFYGVSADAAVGGLAIDLLGREWGDEGRLAEAARRLASGHDWQAELAQVRGDGSSVIVQATLRPVEEADGEVFYAVTMRDITSRRHVEQQRVLLEAAVEQASESVVITDLDANIVYVNPAFEAITGYRREDVIGRNPRVLKSGRQSRQFYHHMWDRLLAGEVFRAEFENRRKDGTLYQETATISPVRGIDGTTKHYVAVKHDVTSQRAFERRIEREARDRTTAMDAIGSLRPGANAEATAAAVGAALVERCGFTAVAILSFEADDQAITLTTAGGRGDATMPRVLPADTSRALVERAQAGPWVETAGPMLAAHRRDVGLAQLAHAPLSYGGTVVGLLAAGTTSEGNDPGGGRLDFLVEIAAIVSGLLGPALEGRRATASTRQRIQAVLDQRAFRPVFQPLVHLESGTVIGHEALTRFDDHTPPDVVFATAHRCAIGLELEERTIEAALEEAGTLPANLPLHINVSPAMLLDPDRLPRLLAASGWNVTLEVTEHEPIEDYAAIRDAIVRLGTNVELAVDDAGAGFASLRHILELRPSVVKLDRSLVAGIDADPPRQALVAGMVHFAVTTGFDLIGEGVETEAERATLLALGVRGGQGWLFGRPAAAPGAPPAIKPVLPVRAPSPDRLRTRRSRVATPVAATRGAAEQ